MLNLDMNRCVSCSDNKECKEKKALLPVLSQLQAEINMTETEKSPDISLIVACKRSQ